MSQVARHELIKDLKERLRAMEQSCRPSRAPVGSTGLEALDRLLPARGLEGGTLIEWLGESEGSGAATLALTVAARALGSGALVVIDGKREFYPPAAARLGIALEQTVVVQPGNAADARWAFEQSLRCRAVAVALGWVEGLNDRVFRRLQLAAEAGGGLGFLLRPAACRAAPSWAEVRLLVRASPPLGSHKGLFDPISIQAMSGQRLRIEVLSCRGGVGGRVVELELSDEADSVPVAAPLAGPALPARAARA